MTNDLPIEQFLINCASQIAQTFGIYCETAVYRIEGDRNHILAIYNRRITNRDIGDSYEALLDTEDQELRERMKEDFRKRVNTSNVYLYRMDGKLLKVTTMHYPFAPAQYALSIAFDDTVLSLAESALRTLNQPNLYQVKNADPEDRKLEEVFETCHTVVGIPIYMMGKKERLEMVRLLKDRNAFSFQKSIPYVASRLHVSRYSIYNYLKELEEDNNQKKG